MITAGIKNGATVFNGIGALSLDEIYSPVQLVLDLEMLKQGARLRDHWQCDEPNDTDCILEQIRFGLKDGYISADETLDSFAQCVWNSRLFTRYSLAEYSRRGEKEALKKAHDLAESFAGQPPVYRPNSHTRKEMISICKAAYREVTGSCWYPEIMAKD